VTSAGTSIAKTHASGFSEQIGQSLQKAAELRKSVFASDSFSETHQRMCARFIPHQMRRLSHAGPFNAHYASLAFPSFDISLVTYSGEVCIEGPPPTHFLCLQFTLAGECLVGAGAPQHRIGPAQLHVMNADTPIYQNMLDGYAQLNIRVDRAALERTLADMTSAPAEKHISFIREPIPLDEDLSELISLLSLICESSSRPGSVLESEAVRLQFDRAFLAVLAGSVPNNYQSRLYERQSRAKPWYVRRAEAFMRNNLRETIGLTDIVAATGVSARTLHMGFRAHHNTSPLNYLKNLRLETVRRCLQGTDTPVRNVTDVALEHGFNHLGKFAGDYRKRFGETPSATLRRRA
jgi:AraC-like DNA-binding protein